MEFFIVYNFFLSTIQKLEEKEKTNSLLLSITQHQPTIRTPLHYTSPHENHNPVDKKYSHSLPKFCPTNTIYSDELVETTTSIYPPLP